ncbi:MAG: hypothetical protein H6Q90_4268 [Deltaproteobacteria bacterium]|nr:hypothetical protein [Deltaproteobacteria bacterium]
MATCAAGPDACIEAEVAICFVDGALGPDLRAEVERRIDACARCRGVVAEAARGVGSSAAGATRVERPPGRVPPADPRPDGPRPAVVEPVADGLAAGEAVGRYIVERPLGAGGMGVVSLARDPELKRAVVIKLVRPDVLDSEGNDGLEARLRREAQAMAQLSHPNVVQIFDIGRHRDRVFLAMEFIAGQTLDAWLIEKPRTVGEILAMFRQAGAGLEAAHRAGLLHRDFKPTNVLVDRDDTAKVTDFGLARAAGAAARTTSPIAVPRTSGVHAVLTHMDAVVGTPAYMAPEQQLAQAVDARSDQYAFALTLLDSLLGQRPSRRAIDPARDPDAVEPALAKAEVPAGARGAIARALQQDPSARFASLAGLLAELAPVRRDRRWLAIAGLAIAAAAITTGFALRQRAPEECSAASTRVWAGGPRDRVLQALAARPAPFAAWSGEQLVQTIDQAVAEVAEAELARCRGQTSPPAAEGCLERRGRALVPTIAALTALAANEDPWRRIRPITDCAEHDDATVAALRAELGPTLTAARARQIAERASQLVDHRLRADALHHAGRATLATGDLAAAETDFREQENAGLRVADEQIRARSRLDFLELARWRLEAKAVANIADELHAIMTRHHAGPEDELVVATAEAAALFEVGDVNGCFAANQRALAAATKLHSDDAQLGARALRARALAELRFDPEAGRQEIEAALAAHPAARPAARAEALLVAGDLAVGRGDGTTAVTAFREAARLDPARASALALTVRRARARGLAGDPDGALGELAHAPTNEPESQLQLDAARGQILVAAGRADEAWAPFHAAYKRIDRNDYLKHPALPYHQALQIALEHCGLDAQRGSDLPCNPPPQLLNNLDPHAPAHFLLHLQRAAQYALESRAMQDIPLGDALEILVANQGSPLRIAELRWQIAQIDGMNGPSLRWQHAHDARAVFAASHRTADVSAIDAWIVEKAADPQFRFAVPIPVVPSPAAEDAGTPAPAPDPAGHAGGSSDPWAPTAP